MAYNKVDLAGGAILLLIGGGVALQALQYGLGSLGNIGPGLFPLAAGALLAALGAWLVATALRGRDGSTLPPIRWGAAASVLGGLLAWAVLTPLFGLVPGTIALVLVASFAAGRPSPALLIGLMVVLCAAGILLFVEALGLPIPIFRF